MSSSARRQSWLVSAEVPLRDFGPWHMAAHLLCSANYHPAGAFLTTYVGPLRVDVMASDVLAARLFAGEVGLDVGYLLGAGAPSSSHSRQATWCAASPRALASGWMSRAERV